MRATFGISWPSTGQGTFDEEDAQGVASLCLLALAALDEEGKSTEFRARSLKKDIEFAEASAYSVLKNSKIDGKKPSEAALAQLVVLDPDVQRISKEQIEAERVGDQVRHIVLKH